MTKTEKAILERIRAANDAGEGANEYLFIGRTQGARYGRFGQRDLGKPKKTEVKALARLAERGGRRKAPRGLLRNWTRIAGIDGRVSPVARQGHRAQASGARRGRARLRRGTGLPATVVVQVSVRVFLLLATPLALLAIALAVYAHAQSQRYAADVLRAGMAHMSEACK